MKSIIYILSIVLCSLDCYAQYFGGINDGSSVSLTLGTKLDGNIVAFAALYRAGNGDGFDKTIKNIILDGNTLSLYNGGSSDGFSEAMTSNSITGTPITILYIGANGDGFNSTYSSSLVLNGIDLTSMYKGTIGDGSNSTFLNNILLNGFMTNLYAGGIGDGQSVALLADTFLLGFMTSLYEGGFGDGSASLTSSGKLLEGFILAIFNGGSGDGYGIGKTTSPFILNTIEALNKLKVLLYPNPANNIVNIAAPTGTIIKSVQLFDMSGQSYHLKLLDDGTLNVSSLSDGIYLLHIYANNGKITKKLMVKK